MARTKGASKKEMTSRPRKGGGSKLSRSEIVTIRLNPKLRYLAELAARRHRRTLSSFIEWALERETLAVVLSGYDDSSCQIGLEAHYLWDVDEAERFAKLANRYPELLTHQEEVLWKLILETTSLWMSKDKSQLCFLNLPRLREYWEKLKGVASGMLPDLSLEPLKRLPLVNEFGQEVQELHWPE